MTLTPHYEAAGVTLFHGDCLDVLRELPDESVHAVVTDPPYGIAFMGKAWDQPGEFGSERRAPGLNQRRGAADAALEAGRYDLSPSALLNFQRWCEAWARECFRVLKPGGHLLSFGGSRTWHRLAAGVEDAGFETRDSIAWLYGSGFPKSLDVGKALPEWEGWGTALKPAFEPIVVARKRLAGTVAANVLAHGTGALNIDATRTATAETIHGSTRPNDIRGGRYAQGSATANDLTNYKQAIGGRWPANVVLDKSQAAELDRQAPDTGAQRPVRGSEPSAPVEGGGIYGRRERVQGPFHGDRGGASRMFPTFRYEAKAPTSERPVVDGVQHPTVKPLELMQWLVRLVTPKGGTVLEPFAGSGTTVEACLREGFDVIAIEREADYLPLIEKRIRKDHAQGLDFDWGEAS